MDENNFTTRKTVTENDVIAFYDDYAKSWDERFKPSAATKYFLQKRWESFLEIVDSDHKNSNALELGIGTGVYISDCSRLFKNITAVDGSISMVEIVKKKVQSAHIRNVQIVQANVLDLADIKTGSVDIVYFFGLIEHVIDIEKFVSEIRRVLKDGGTVVGVTPNKKCPWYILRFFVRGTGKHCTTDKYFSVTDLKNIFTVKGFALEKTLYWGAVPAGVQSGHIVNFLTAVERIFEKTILRYFLGGLTFKFRKKHSA